MDIRKYKNFEYSAINFSALEGRLRIDAEFYHPEYLRVYDAVTSKKYKTLGNLDTVILHPSEIKREYSDEGVTFFRTQNLRPLNITFESSEVFISSDDAKKLKSNLVNHGDVVITRTGANFGDTAIYFGQREPLIASSHILIVRTKKVNPFYLGVFLNSFYGRKLIDKGMYGGLQPEIAPSYLYTIPIPVVSKKFQNEIQQLVETSYSLQQKALKEYKAAEDMLFKELNLDTWKPKKIKFKNYKVQFEIEDNHSIIKLSTMLKGDRLDAEFWDAACLELLERLSKFETTKLRSEIVIKNGFPFQSKQFIEVGEGEPFIRIRDCKPHFIQTADLTKLDNDYVRKLKLTKANTGDIVIGMDGLKWFYSSLVVEPVYVNQRVCHIQIKPKSQFTSEYILLVINSKIGQMQLLRQMTIADTVGHIKNTDVAGLIIPVSKNVKAITKKVKSVQLAEQQSKSLIDVAKKAVEIFIEQDEKEAFKHIKNEQNKVK
ncbi:hypothetical protein IQ13_2155 [Lacibacter cauensis]|uniref:Type I restriction enzyme S subunit n=1 Tax=Lacibacter cauensis TaxID=510947 RepID=A0A562SK33_9BACT|nr:hypothetical protein [Lacibacter cauensis]TWI81140.1 hypothetical protein IQ13_2155 [Lacibacter cauensis]